jgi:elongation factor G
VSNPAVNPDEEETQLPLDPVVTVGSGVLEYLQLDSDTSPEECMVKSPVYKALVQGCLGALRRGPVGSYPLANVKCHVEEIDAEEGLSGLQVLPGALRAAAMNAVSTTLSENLVQCRALEPAMGVEISVPNDMVGTVLSDLTGRRGAVEDVLSGDGDASIIHRKTLVRAEVPLVEILGYANALRSLTGGEATFTAEYRGHSICNETLR